MGLLSLRDLLPQDATIKESFLFNRITIQSHKVRVWGFSYSLR